MGHPHDNPTSPYWLSQDLDLSRHRTTKELPAEADVVVLGSGYSGATAAFYLLKDNHQNPPSVLILEARDTCSGATGRNGGHLKPDVYAGAAIEEREFGREVALQLAKFESQEVFDVKRLVEAENIDCDFELIRAIDVFLDRRTLEPAVTNYTSLKASGYQFSDDVHFITDPTKAEQVSGVKGALAAWSFTAASLWPYKLVTHLLRRCLEWTANLQTFTPVLSISDSPDKDGRWILRTSRGQVAAKKVVVATNAYTILPDLAGKIIPTKGVACRIAVPESSRPAPHLSNSYSIRYGPGEYDYLISKTDGSIVVGGAKQVVLLKNENWYNNLDDSDLIAGSEEYFRNYMQRTFHGWENTHAEVTDIWTGIMGYSADLKPWVGEMPGRPGVFVSAGFTGHGMPRIHGCSAAIAALIRGNVQSLAETSVPGPYWITRERLDSGKNIVHEYMGGSRNRL